MVIGELLFSDDSRYVRDIKHNILKTVISLLSKNEFGIDYKASLLAPMVSNFLVNHTTIKNGKLSSSSKGFFLKAL